MKPVKPRTHKQDSLFIVYDADRVQQPGPQLFDPDHWEQQGAVSGKAQGRGSALFLDTQFGPAVLRQYLRGGQAARISRDRYVFSGFERSRPVAEFRILARLHEKQMPVPAPLAALCRRQGAFYRGWLLTRRIEPAEPLADQLELRSRDEDLWRQLGRLIRRFHRRGVVHADLNVRNILVGGEQGLFLIDFDRARISRPDPAAGAANLRRLRRSLEKCWPDSAKGRLEPCWRELNEAYQLAGETA